MTTLFNTLKLNMAWHNDRHRVLVANIANADTPGYRRHDLLPLANTTNFSLTLKMALTNSRHIARQSIADLAVDQTKSLQVTGSGNAVTLEEELSTLTENQLDYRALAFLYSTSLGLVRKSIGRQR